MNNAWIFYAEDPLSRNTTFSIEVGNSSVLISIPFVGNQVAFANKIMPIFLNYNQEYLLKRNEECEP